MYVELRDSIFDIDPTDPHKITIKPMFLQLKPISDFMRSRRFIDGDSDGRHKLRHQKELAWIFHMNSIKSPYAKYPPDTKEGHVTKAIFGGDSNWKPDDKVKELEALYTDLTESPMYRLLRACYTNLGKAADYFENIDYGQLDATGKTVWTTENVFKSMERLGKLYESLNKLKEQLDKEETGKAGDIRKQVSVTPFNMGKDVSDMIEH